MTAETIPGARAPESDARVSPVTPPEFEAVYEAHFRYAWRCLRSLGVDDAQLDDAVQDVFVVVHRKLEAFDGGVRVTTWIYEIVLRVARRYRSRAARQASRIAPLSESEVSGPSASGASLERSVESRDELVRAREALATLSEAKREVFVLACVEQRTAPEIAKLIGVPLNTVYSRLRAAKQAFATALGGRRSGRGGGR